MIDSCMVMPGNTDDPNDIIRNSVKDSIKPLSIWNKIVNTIEGSNIDMEKLLNDSIEYGINLGLFQQGNGGRVLPLESLSDLSTTTKDQIPSSSKHKIAKNISKANLKLKPLSRSESGSYTCSSTEMPYTIQTRRSSFNNDLKRPMKLLMKVKKIKRTKTELLTPVTNNFKSPKVFKDKTFKSSLLKPINREMARAVPICAYCLGDELINKRTELQEDMIVCWDCGTCAHPTCLRWPQSLLEKVRTIRWQCLQCKCCSYCGNVSKRDHDMLLCDACDQGFHMYCLRPPIKTPPKGEWICPLCRPSQHNKNVKTCFSLDDFKFFPNCQIVTSENVQELCRSRKRLPNALVRKKPKINNYILKSESKVVKGRLKLSLLHLKKKKLLEKAVKRQKSALTDGLSMFFTPGNKRQSRVSKKSLTSNNLNNLTDLIDHKSSISSSKDRSSLRSHLSRNRSISPPISLEKEKSHKHKGESAKLCKLEVVSNVKMAQNEYSPLNSGSTIDSLSSGNKRHVHASNSKDSYTMTNSKRIKKPLRKPKKRLLMELKPDSVADASTTESSNATIPRTDQSSTQSTMFTDNMETDPYPISDLDRRWYLEIQNKVAELLPAPMDTPPQLHSLNKTSRHRTEHSEPPELSREGTHTKDNINDAHDPTNENSIYNPNQRFPPRIQIGKYVIDTWYSAPYPSEYARLNILYICEYCLKHIKSYDVYIMHTEKCTQHFPPGNEIYRNGDLSVFEVDGYVSKLYCQQLCLLAKLFLDHKTLYYDVEPFLFYVSVISRNQSCHIIGYFSKEKRSTHKYNLSCIMVLPPYQKFNYGRFLIDFSYLLSRNEGQNGSPEKPLSTLGRLSYESYWKSKVIPYLLNRDNVTGDFYRHVRFSKPPKGLSITIDKISAGTGINPHDVASTIQMLSKTVDLDESDRITIQLDWEKIKMESEKYSKKYPNWIPLKADCLRWVPLMQSNDKCTSNVKEPNTLSPQPASESKAIKTTDISTVSKSQSDKPNKKVGKKSIKASKSDKESSDNEINDQRYQPKVQKRSLKPYDTSIVNKSLKSSLKLKSSPKCKLSCNERTIVTRNQCVRQFRSDEPQILTRNRSISKQLSLSNQSNPADMIKVDLTCSDASDNQDNYNEDCCVTKNKCSLRNSDLRNSMPILELFKETFVATSDSSTNKSKSSPPINTNEPSPVSTTQNAIICSTLVSPEIDLEDETETDLILSGSRRPLIILEKCDDQSQTLMTDMAVIDLSDDSTVADDVNNKVDHQFDREMTITVSDNNSKSITPELVSTDSGSQESDPGQDFSLSNIEFILPTCIKDPSSSEELAPILTRVSSQGSNSGHQDDSSNSLQLPSDISLNEEFKRFYNDGHVFNTITTSHTTDSSDKDADESLLSVSNSDLEMNGAYFCDSSMCCLNKPTSITALVAKPDDDQQLDDDNHIQCSPCQSDLIQSQVSSTTPFISPSIVWNSSMKNLSSSVNSDVIVAEQAQITSVNVCYEDGMTKDHHKVMDIGDMPVDKDIVSSSLGSSEDSAVPDEQYVGSSMALATKTP